MMSPTMVPSLADGFTAVTNICRDALKQIAERLSAQYMTASWPASVHLDWADFELCGGDDGEPHLTQQHVCYYRARHASLAPKGCVLMVCLIAYLLALLCTRDTIMIIIFTVSVSEAAKDVSNDVSCIAFSMVHFLHIYLNFCCISDSNNNNNNLS